MSAARRFLKAPFNLLMAWRPFRSRAAFDLTHRYFDDLNLSIPLSHGFACPVLELDALYSFSEIFATNEYGSFLDLMPLPRRWLDLGCHAGYFSLYLAWQHAVRGGGEFRALLVDADARSGIRTGRTLRVNKLEDRLLFRHGAIARDPGELRFVQRGGMGSSLAGAGAGAGAGELRVVRVIEAGEIASLLPPPYDLIKIDIEGAEMDFLAAYQEIYTQAKHVIVEWHSWDLEGRNEGLVRAGMERAGFRLTAVLKPKMTIELDGKPLTLGLHLYGNSSAK
jgi:FkbM family methyltransferase